MDRWVLAELHQLVRQVTQAYEDYDTPAATRPIEAFVEVLSNWYVRLNRRRFWKSGSDADKLAAYATLYECLVTVSKLTAPAVPFISEALYRNLVADQDASAPDSVHLAQWPACDEKLIEQDLIAEMRLVQRLVSVGLAARMNNEVEGRSSPIGVRQPLARAEFAVRDALSEAPIVEKYSELIASELNVKQVSVMDAETAGRLVSVSYELNPLPQFLGRKLGKDFKRVQDLLRGGDQEVIRPWAEALVAGRPAAVVLDGQSFELLPEEVEVRVIRESSAGYTVAEDRGYLAALDTGLTPELVNEGIARELVRRIQTARRNAGFELVDRIEIVYTASGRLQEAVSQFQAYIQAETLAEVMQQQQPGDGFYCEEFTFKGDLEGEHLAIGLRLLS